MQQSVAYPQSPTIVNDDSRHSSNTSGQRFTGNVSLGHTRVRVCDTFTVMMMWVRLALAIKKEARS